MDDGRQRHYVVIADGWTLPRQHFAMTVGAWTKCQQRQLNQIKKVIGFFDAAEKSI
jgi:hypothetical protein